jgi:hypothetical protein
MSPSRSRHMRAGSPSGVLPVRNPSSSPIRKVRSSSAGVSRGVRRDKDGFKGYHTFVFVFKKFLIAFFVHSRDDKGERMWMLRHAPHGGHSIVITDWPETLSECTLTKIECNVHTLLGAPYVLRAD